MTTELSAMKKDHYGVIDQISEKGEITMFMSFKSSGTTLNINDILNFNTDIDGCSAYKLETFSDKEGT